jgi:DNA polymerase-3 subunit alpha
MKFVHLHTHSHYSLLDGLAKIDDLIDRAKELGMKALTLTDHGNLYGAIEFYKKAIKGEIKPILGVETYVAYRSRFEKQTKVDDKYFHLILLCENNLGWQNLIQLVTKSYLEGFYYRPRVDRELLRQYHEGLIALSACPAGEIPQLLSNNKFEEAEKVAKEYQEIFGQGNFFLEIGHHPNIPDIAKINEGLIKLSQKTGIPLVATQDIHYLKSEDADYHDILLAVQTGNKIDDVDRLTLKADDFSMRSQEEMMEFFKDLPEAIENTVKIAERCNVTLPLNQILLPAFPLPEGEISADDYLRKLVMERLLNRFEVADAKVMERLDYELEVIKKTGFADYFLIVQDFVNWAKERGIVVGPGRGSAAGSLVSYVLGITDIDPLKYDLLFERFLNPDRISMPDIDLDFTDVRRDEVFAYIRQKYGEDKVAQIITFGTMAARAAVRDAGRALGLAYAFCDQLAKLIPFNPAQGMKVGWLDKSLQNVTELKSLYQNNPDAKKVIDAARQLEGVARHASVHACGIVISKEPLVNYVPLQRSPQDENIIITQFEMHSIEDLGLLKIDLLGLKNLTIIEEAVRLIKELHDEEIDISKIPLDDKKTFKLLQEGDTTGVFQLESSGMRRNLKELKPTELEDIIAMVSLYRPGPMELIPSFINRKHGREKVKYLHPKLEPILENTYGIGIYQEQMMRIARDLASFSLAEADTLRKAIGKKIKVLLETQKEKLMKGMMENGIDEKTAKEIWELFPPFARYGFNRCLTGDTAVINPENGEPITIENLYQKKAMGLKVFSLENNLKIKSRPIAEIFYNGKKSVWKITTRSNRKIKATSNHPFLTPDGWKKLEDINIGDKIATPRVIPEPSKPISIETQKLGLLGYLLAEGNFCHPHSFYFYSKSREEINDYLNFLEAFENTVGKIDESKAAIAVYTKRKNLKKESAAASWIKSLGLKYKRATEKFFPDFVYRLSNKDLSLLIGKMFQGDGCVNLKRKDPQIFYSTSSVLIAAGLQHFLLRFGILSTIHDKKFKYRNGIKKGYTITIGRYDNIKKFIEIFGGYFVGEKSAAIKKILLSHPILNGSIPVWSGRGSFDTIPVTLVKNQMREVIYNNALSFKEFARQTGVSERLFFDDKKKIGYLRETVNLIANQLNHQPLISLSESDVYWDEIKKIESAGIEDTYDLKVDGTHNFIANDIFVHNSHAACYALIAYRTAYLKAHWPIEFMTALLNAEAGDVERIAFLVSEAQKNDIQVLPPDINKSFVNFIPEGENIRFGLLAIKNVGLNIVEAIIEERQRGGPFQNLSDFLRRVQHKDLNKKSLESLIKVGVFDSLDTERGHLLSNLDNILSFCQNIKKSQNSSQVNLFGINYHAPAFLEKKSDANIQVASLKEKLAWERELLGLYISGHPLKQYLEKLQNYKVRPIKEILAKKEESNSNGYQIAGVISKAERIISKLGQPILFVKIEDLSGALEIVVFSDTLAKNPTVWRENNVIIANGRLSWRNNEPKFICQQAVEL